MGSQAGKSHMNLEHELAIVDGAAADTDIAVPRITVGDILKSVYGVNTTTHAATDRTATTSITSDGNIQCTDVTTGELLHVLFNKHDPLGKGLGEPNVDFDPTAIS